MGWVVVHRAEEGRWRELAERVAVLAAVLVEVTVLFCVLLERERAAAEGFDDGEAECARKTARKLAKKGRCGGGAMVQ